MSDTIVEKKIAFHLESKMEGYLSNLVKAEQATKSSIDQIVGHFGRVGGGINSLIGITGTLTGILAGGAMFKDMVSTTNAVTGEVARLSKGLGITAEQASVLRIALDDAFLSADDMITGSNRLTKQLLTNEDAFTRLGVSTRNSDGSYRDIVSIMTDVNDKLRGLREGTDQNVAGMSVYGRSWSEVRGLLKLTGGAMEDAKKRAEELHLTIGPEQIEASKKYKLALKDMEDVSESLKVQLGKELIPELTRLGVEFADVAVKFIPYFINGLHYAEATVRITGASLDRFGASLARVMSLAAGGNLTQGGRWWQGIAADLEGRAQGQEKALQSLAYREAGLDENGNRVTAVKPPPPPLNPDDLKGGMRSDTALQRENQYIEAYNRLQDERRKGGIEGNVTLTETQKKLAEIALKYQDLIRIYPEHRSELERNQQLDEQQLKNLALLKDAEEDLRVQREMAMDELENGVKKSEEWLNYMGQLSAAQQARFDESSQQSRWGARNASLDSQAQAAGAAYMGEGNPEIERLNQERDAAIQNWAMMTDSFEEYERRKTLIEQQYSARRIQIEAAEARTKLGYVQSGFNSMSTIAGAFYQLSGQRNKAALRAYQITKSGETTIATGTAAMNAYSAMAGIPYVGPALGVAAALAAIAFGAVQLQSIWSVSPDGGGGSLAAGGGSVPSVDGSSAIVPQPSGAPQQAGPQYQIVINGAIGEKKWFEDNLPEILKDFASRNVSAGVAYA